jgi:hypothetical protein
MINEIKQLSDIERKLLLMLNSSEKSFSEFATNSFGIDSIRRAAGWLSEKNFAIVNEKKSEKYFLKENGQKALEQGMPEFIFLRELKKIGGEATFEELQSATKLNKQEFNIALGLNKKKRFYYNFKWKNFFNWC